MLVKDTNSLLVTGKSSQNQRITLIMTSVSVKVEILIVKGGRQISPTPF